MTALERSRPGAMGVAPLASVGRSRILRTMEDRMRAHDTAGKQAGTVRFRYVCTDCGAECIHAGRCSRCSGGIVLPVPVFNFTPERDREHDESDQVQD